MTLRDTYFENIAIEAFDNCKIGIVKKETSKGLYTFSNHQILGLASESISINEFIGIIHDDYKKLLLRPLDKNATSSDIHLPLLINGSFRWVSFSFIKKENDENGNNTSWFLYKIDDNSIYDYERRSDKIIEQQLCITNALSSIIGDNYINKNVDNMLKEILSYFHGSKCYIFEYDFPNNIQICKYQVVDGNIDLKINNNTISLDDSPLLNEKILNNNPLIIYDIDDIKEIGEKEYAILKGQGISSAIIVPLSYKETIWGYLGIDIIGKTKKWTKLDLYLLSSFSTFIGNCIGLHDAMQNVESLLKEQQENNAKLIKAKDKAEAIDHTKSVFLANMSHEIRTPLNAIMGFANILLMDAHELSSEKAYYLSIIKDNSELLLQLINDILDLSNIEVGKIDFSYSTIDINNLIKRITKTHNLEPQKGVIFRINTPLKVCKIRSDKNRITQVLINLISNAIKFTSKGSITIGYNIVDDEKNIEFYVEDTGMGIDENDMQKIFNSFVKLNTYISGTGLGLTICKNIVEQMKGSISVSSVKGEGSRFSFKIPYEPIYTEMAQPYNVGVSNDNDPVILVVEDNESNFILLSAILKSYSLLWAEDGPSALDMYYQHKPDLILMDIQIPGENGLIVTSKIRETDKKTPIIALTANAFESDKDVAMEAGCNEFLTKPVNFSTLKTLIKKYLNK